MMDKDEAMILQIDQELGRMPVGHGVCPCLCPDGKFFYVQGRRALSGVACLVCPSIDGFFFAMLMGCCGQLATCSRQS